MFVSIFLIKTSEKSNKVVICTNKCNYTEKLRSYSVVSEQRMSKCWEMVKKVLEVPTKYKLQGRKNYLQVESIRESNVMKQRKTCFKYQPNF